MAQDIQPGLSNGPAAPQHFHPPSARELRAQAVHRLQVGLFGLAAMLLLVALANIIMDRARQTRADSAPVIAQPSGATGRSDPLADIGVVPAADATQGKGNDRR